jgi:hypothetical protein
MAGRLGLLVGLVRQPECDGRARRLGRPAARQPFQGMCAGSASSRARNGATTLVCRAASPIALIASSWSVVSPPVIPCVRARLAQVGPLQGPDHGVTGASPGRRVAQVPGLEHAGGATLVGGVQDHAAAASGLTGSGDLRGALAGLDEIAEQAAQVRRSLKAATGGRKAPAARPGGLRDKVLAHLDEHPDGEFTPHSIHKVLSHSSGAIANALDTLVKLGDAELATEKPSRFRRAPSRPQPPPRRAA